MIYIFGHKNPDTDSVTAAITLSTLKNKLGFVTEPRVLGPLNKETKFVLAYFKVPPPAYLANVKTQLQDLNYDQVPGIKAKESILFAYRLMEKRGIRVLPVIGQNQTLLGIITMQDIAMGLIKGDIYYLETKISNIITVLGGQLLAGEDVEVQGKITVISYYYETMVKGHELDEDSIVIVGDRYDVIEYALLKGVQLIIVTGGKPLPLSLLEKATKAGVNLILVPENTYKTAKLLNQCNYVASIMKTKGLVQFYEHEYLEEIKEELITNRHYLYPVVTKDHQYLGLVSRRHLLNPQRKKVILVDHNEYAQSVPGLEEAEILEVIDHHKIGDILTVSPISFRNLPVGSTSTIIFTLFKEKKVEIAEETAGLLLAGIISDTLALQSPTTTTLDRRVAEELTRFLKLDLQEFATKMFKAGTSLEGESVSAIFYKDFKEFMVQKQKVGLSQIFTLDLEDIFQRQAEFLQFIKEVQIKNNYNLTILIVTDLLKNGSYLFFQAQEVKIMEQFLGKEAVQGVFVAGLVSRKKQVVPQIMELLNQDYLF